MQQLSAGNRKNIIVNVSDRCNYSCKYCYIGERFDKPAKVISDSTIDTLFEKIKDMDLDSVGFIWHGGEPLLAGFDFFKNIVEKEKSLGKPVRNSVQTNGSLLDEKILDLFQENNFSIGISLDGPKDLHDLVRSKTNGVGTFEEVTDAFKRLQARNYQNWGVITVLTQLHAGREIDLYNTYKALGVSSVRINPLFASAETQNTGIPSLTKEMLSEFYKTLYKIWKADANPIRVEPLVDLVKLTVGNYGRCCFFSQSCATDWLAVMPNGDAYHCNRFGSKENLRLGNVLTDTLKVMYNKKLNLLNGKPKELGCLFEAYSETGSFDPDKAPATQAYRELLEFIKADLQAAV